MDARSPGQPGAEHEAISASHAPAERADDHVEGMRRVFEHLQDHARQLGSGACSSLTTQQLIKSKKDAAPLGQAHAIKDQP